MDKTIVEVIAAANSWDHPYQPLVRLAVGRAEDAWNAANDNSGIVVEKHISAEDLLKQDPSDSMREFLAFAGLA